MVDGVWTHKLRSAGVGRAARAIHSKIEWIDLQLIQISILEALQSSGLSDDPSNRSGRHQGDEVFQRDHVLIYPDLLEMGGVNQISGERHIPHHLVGHHASEVSCASENANLHLGQGKHCVCSMLQLKGADQVGF